MKLKQFNEVVSKDGTVVLSGLPPDKEVRITVNPQTWEEEFREWQKEFQANSPFKGMSDEEIMEDLRKLRDSIPNER